MATKNELISDIELRLYKGKPSDDIELSRSQVSHWIDITREDILSDMFNEALRRGGSIDPFYVFKEECLTLSKETTSCDKDCKDFRYFIELANDVMPLHKSMGIIRVVDNYGRSLVGTNENFSEVLASLPFVGTSTKSQTFYLENKKIYIEKHTTISSDLYEYTVFYIPQRAGDSVDDDDNYPIEDSLVPLLLDRVEEVARRQMELGVADIDNDGTDPYHIS